MIDRWVRFGSLPLLLSVMVLWLLASASVVRAQDCGSLLSLFQQGRSVGAIAQLTGLTTTQVADCRRQLQRPVFVGPAGAPPLGAVGPAPIGAAGPAPRNAAGPPPVGAAGPPPAGAAGPPPVGREVKRLP